MTDLVDSESPAEAAVEVREGLDAPKSFSRLTWQRFIRHRLAIVGAIGLLLVVATFILGPMLSPHPFDGRNIRERLQGPSWNHPFGTDEIGRDLFVRVLTGGRYSIRIALLVAVLATVLGTVLGAMAGFLGRWVDMVISQVITMVLIVPSLIILLIFSRRYGASPTGIAILLALLLWTRIARVVRGVVMQFKEQEFVQAARAAGASNTRIIFRHIMPNVVGAAVVEVTLLIGIAIVLESTLSFLGLGVQPPTPTLGNLVYQAKGSIDSDPLRVLLPGMFVVAIVLFVNFLGDGLRDALDPKTKVEKN